jgi:hypothetical protein
MAQENPDQDNLELGDIENFKGNQDNLFSHSALVMRSMNKVLECGATELRSGWFNIKRDKNTGVETRTYIPDTRESFISSIKTCEMMLSCDLDTEAENAIKIIKTELESKRLALIKDNDINWEKISNADKMEYVRHGIGHTIGHLDFPALRDEFIFYEVESQRKIFCELNKLCKRLNFFADETIGG